MPFIPLAIMGVQAGMQAYQAHKAGKAAKAQQGIAQQQSALAQQMGGFAKNQYDFGQPASQKAMEHYMRLAGGDRNTLQGEIAPEENMMADSFRGAERGMESRLMPGPSRERAIADLYRRKASSMAMLPFYAREKAFQGLEGMGQKATGNALSFYGGAQTGLGNAAGTMKNAADMQQQAGKQWGEVVGSIGGAAGGAYDWYKNRAMAPGAGVYSNKIPGYSNTPQYGGYNNEDY